MFQIDLTKDYPKVLESQAIIRFQDCDPLQHLNNAKYFDYFFNAREDQVAKVYGLKPSDFFNDYMGTWVSYNHQIAYLRPALVGEWVTIRSAEIYFDADTSITEFYMMDEHKTVLKSVFRTTSKFIDGKTGKKTNHPPHVIDYLTAIKLEIPHFESLSFNERIKQIKAELKG
jgi:acyl-CoA thioester hydrolase